jgi:tetratricopeptide (TPR) repeat protein
MDIQEERDRSLGSNIKDWVDSVRQRIPLEAAIPPVNSIRVDKPWDDWLDELFEHADNEGLPFALPLLRNIESELILNPSDVATRFTALAVYYDLVHLSSIWVPKVLEEDAETNRYRHQQHLAYLVRLVSVDECPDWRRIRWEILNAYSICDWDRALDLFNRAERAQAADSIRVQLMRGEFGFIRLFEQPLGELLTSVVRDFGKALTEHYSSSGDKETAEQCRRVDWSDVLFPYGTGLESLEWVPEVRMLGNFLQGEREDAIKENLRLRALYECASRVGKADPAPVSHWRDMAMDAANDLEKALDKSPDVSLVYRAMLARLHHSTSNFPRAAMHYEKLLAADKQVEGLRPLAYRSLVISLRRAGQGERAREVLEKQITEFPQDADAFKELAEAQAGKAEFQAAYENLRKAVDLEPKLEEEIGVRIGLALGGALEGVEASLSALKPDAGTYQSIVSVLTRYWPPFARMTEQAREKWIMGAWQLDFFSSEGRAKPLLQREAAIAFATAVEIEVREKVFSWFRQQVGNGSELQAFAQLGLAQDESKVFCQYLLAGKPITFGQMIYVLRRAQHTDSAIFGHFGRWLQQAYPGLPEYIPLLSKVCNFRNPGVHGGPAIIGPEGIPEACKEIAECL